MRIGDQPCEACGGLDIHAQPLAPTVEAVDEWLNQPHVRTGWPSHMVDIRTKSGQWRCVHSSSGEDSRGRRGWWTIRGEGSSNGGRETWVYADKIVQARAHTLHSAHMEREAVEKWKAQKAVTA